MFITARKMAAIHNGQILASAQNLVEMVRKSELEIVQILNHNMGGKIVRF